ncbi:tail fiber assembly protein, partial [Salmonella enterica]|nr:tail fiber assembly protein [Salmonella enterica]
MMHLKNIVAGNPKTPDQYQLTKKFGVVWLYDEKGKNWYEEQKNFAADTLKVAYDKSNIIVAINKDASKINPEGRSVVELPDITANRRADVSGRWIYDGEREQIIRRVY